MIPISETTITRAWLASVQALEQSDRDVFSLVASIASPGEPTGVEALVRRHIDGVLTAAGLQDTQTVANTVFPVALASQRPASALYDVYRTRAFPVLRRIPQNKRGTYFLRMIERKSRDAREQQEWNPLEEMLDKMRAELRRGHHALRCAYELAVYDPAEDARVRMGFPCLSHVSIKMDPAAHLVHLTALYRNQRYIERAYGNFLGLARLQAFIAREAGLEVGELVCHATHAQIDHLGTHAVQELLQKSERLLMEAS